MTYPGNAALPREVKDRVVATFRHTVDLFKQGRIDEVTAGCDLVLKMDPSFDPAKKLMMKAQNPGAPIDVDALVPQSTDDGLGAARAALKNRDFQQVMEICSDLLRQDFANEEAQQLGEAAREKLEAAPFVEQFLGTARTHIANNNLTAARTSLDKARSLDDTHPGVAQVEAMLDSPGAQESPLAGGFSFGAEASPFPGSFGAASEPAPPPQPATFDFGSAVTADSPSFVVETPQQGFGFGSPSGGAQATDFGFTFEEEQKPEAPADFSFGAAVSPAAPAVEEFGGSATFDFTTASVDLSADDQAKINKYLAEGDEAYNRGDFQAATDIWSRIFLIDVTNDAASERIERARGKRLEIDQRVEELMVAATLAYEKKDFTTARAKFEEVLQIDPTNYNANEYLDKLNDQQAVASGAVLEIPEPSVSRGAAPDLFEEFEDEETAALPKAAVTKKPTAAAKAAAAPAEKKKLPMPVIAVVVLLVLGAGGYFAYSRFAGGGEQVDASQTDATFQQAQVMAKRGEFDKAIALLAAIPPSDPQHGRAVQMIADLKAKKAEAGGMINGRPAGEVFKELVAFGQAAYTNHDYLAAKKAFEQAAAIQQLPPEANQTYQAALQQVAKLDQAKSLFQQENFEAAISNLETLLAQDANNTNIKQMLADAHFNMARKTLQQEKPAEAIASLDKALALAPNDEVLTRTRELAVRYSDTPVDLLYRIYVKYLPARQAG